MQPMGSRLSSTAPVSMRVRSRDPRTRLRWSAYSFSTLRISRISTATNSRNASSETAVNRKMPPGVSGVRKVSRKAFSAASPNDSKRTTTPSTIITILR